MEKNRDIKEIGMKELSEHNGSDGKSVWVAYQGRVFDLSGSELWSGGIHMGSHVAGRDMTGEIGSAPHGPEMLERYLQIGVLRDEKTSQPVKTANPSLSWLLKKFPMLRRHPHPMTVHFPIVFMFSATVFTILYLIFGIAGFDESAFYCLGAGLIFIPAAMATGYYTWWLNYMARPIRAVSIKKGLSALLLCLDAAAFSWRAVEPDILRSGAPERIFYVMLVLLLLPLVVIIGWYGATLTFPVGKE